MDRKLTFLLFGGIFWGVGAAAIKFLAPWLFLSTVTIAGFFALNFVLAWLTIPLFAKLTGRTKHDMLVPTVIMALAAMVLDAVALSFVPWIYPADMAARMHTGAALLFAFWGFFFFALLWHRPAKA